VTVERTVTLSGTKGDRIVLACPGGPFHLAQNASLWGTSPVIVNAGRLGGLPGEVVSSTGYAPRDLILPVRIAEATNSEQDNLIEQLTEMVRDVEVDVEIEVETAGTRNTRRSIFARYISGLDGVAVQNFLVDNAELRLRFRAHDPYWIDGVGAISGIAPRKFNNAFGGGINHINLVIDATAKVWPTWTITGVTENITAMNLRTGQTWRFTEKLENIGDTLEIRTDPRGETGAFLNGGARIWEFDAPSELWGLEPGRNFINVSGLNQNGDSSIGTFDFTWINRYENC